MRATLIINPSASSVTPRTRVMIQRALSQDHDITVTETERRGHATRLARAASDTGVDVVIVLAGDGTLNEAANGLVGSKTALGVIPGGSTNVFARTIGMTNDPIESTSELLRSLRTNKRRRIGLGKANDRHFLFHVGAGFDAAVIEHVEKRSEVKRYAGHPYFVWSTLTTWANLGGHRSPRFRVLFDSDGTTVESVDSYLTICMNTNPYTYLGNRAFNVAPELNFDNGLAVLSVKSLKLPSLLSVVGSALTSGHYLRDSSHTDYRLNVNSFRIEGFGTFPYQLDGDYLGDVESLTIDHVPACLDVMMP